MIEFCAECTLPLEYCPYGPHPAKCQRGLKENRPELYDSFYTADPPAEVERPQELIEQLEQSSIKPTEKGSAEKPKKASNKKVVIKQAERTWKKCVTTIANLEHFGIDLKATAKKCATKFACGAAVAQDPSTGTDVVMIQGSVMHEAGEYLMQLYRDALNESCISYK